MRFYPEPDVHFYVDISDGWDKYCKTPNKSWKYQDLQPTSTINYWRDLEGAKMKLILKKDTYFDNWMTSRINFNACLPIYYASGNRFIKIQKAFPAGFKCAPLPMNLKEAREMKALLRKQAKLAKKAKKGKGKKGKGKKGK